MMRDSRLLKKDLFGEVRAEMRDGRPCIVRDAGAASPWCRWLARLLLRREARSLAALGGLPGVPALLDFDTDRLTRVYLEGAPLHRARARERAYYIDASRLLRRLHASGVVHNDLAKEPNLLVTPAGRAAFVDFQLAWFAPRRGRLFRTLAYDDIRHLLKHKRTYCAGALTARERAILSRPSLPARIWMRTVKPVYLFVTRNILRWSDREGAADRGERS